MHRVTLIEGDGIGPEVVGAPAASWTRQARPSSGTRC